MEGVGRLMVKSPHCRLFSSTFALGSHYRRCGQRQRLQPLGDIGLGDSARGGFSTL